MERKKKTVEKSGENLNTYAIISFALAIVSLLLVFIIGPCVVPFILIGGILGFFGLKSENYKVLSIIGCLINATILLISMCFLVLALLAFISLYAIQGAEYEMDRNTEENYFHSQTFLK